MEVTKGNLIYGATPFRMVDQTKKIYDFIESKGHFPILPLLLLPPDKVNYQKYRREEIYRICFGLVDICDEVWIFGIGGGSLQEFERAKDSGKPVRSLVKRFDPDWEKRSQKEKYFIKYKKLVDEVLKISE